MTARLRTAAISIDLCSNDSVHLGHIVVAFKLARCLLALDAVFLSHWLLQWIHQIHLAHAKQVWQPAAPTLKQLATGIISLSEENIKKMSHLISEGIS